MSVVKFFDDAYKVLTKQITNPSIKEVGVVVTATGPYRFAWAELGLSKGQIPFKAGFSKHDVEWEGFVNAFKSVGIEPYWEMVFNQDNPANFWFVIRVKPL
jgi:hypothetical protein